MHKLFTSSGYLESEHLIALNGTDLKLETLPAFLRVLLTTDGTVTKSLESYFWEPISVENLGQQYIELQDDAPVIELQAGAKVLHREVQLVGKKTRRIYTHASSLIRAEILEEDVRRDLEEGKVGVGELLRELGLETYREIVGFGQSTDRQILWRRYRIIMNHQPFIQITEEFPIAVFA